MSPGEELALMRDVTRWPLRVVLPLAHVSRVDRWGSPEQAFIAFGFGARLFVGNVGDITREQLCSREAFNAALARLPSLTYLSLEGLQGDGWRVD